MIAWFGNYGDCTTTAPRTYEVTYMRYDTGCADPEPFPVCYNPKPPDPPHRKPEAGHARKLVRRTEKTEGSVGASRLLDFLELHLGRYSP